MANAAVAFDNSALTGTLSTSSAGALTPVTLLQDPQPFRRWLVASASTPSLTLDMGASAAIGFDTFALIAPVVSGTPTMRIRVSTHASGGATAGDAYDQSGIVGYDSDYLPWVHLASAVKTGRWVRFDFTNFTGAGILFAGLRNQFAINFTPGAADDFIDNSKRTKGDAGQSFVDHKLGARTLERRFDCMSEDQRKGFVEQMIVRRIRQGKVDFLWIDDPDSSDLSFDCIYGFNNNTLRATRPFVVDSYDVTLNIEERL